jgi:3-oxoacyl-[acyl-carrier-protein] synthase-3
MVAFKYSHIKELTFCTALPSQKKGNNKLKSISVFEQTTADLGFLAAQNIIQKKEILPSEIGALVFLTKTPDYRGPATAMVLQNRLEIPKDCIVYDSPTGNLGFESGINLGASLLKSISQSFALVVFGDTISKQLSDENLLQLPFQDGATAVILEKGENTSIVSMFSLTLSQKWSSFMIPSGGFRKNDMFFNQLNSKKEHQTAEHLHLDTLKVQDAILPELTIVKNTLSNLISELQKPNVSIIVNLLMPELEKQFQSLLKTEAYGQDVYLSSAHIPQTMAATVPLMIERLVAEKKNFPLTIISVSLGEGLSLNISSIEIYDTSVLETIGSDEFYENGFVTHEM